MDRLSEMEAFATVVDQGGFTDAARKLGISKSAISKHVAALETRLGARLLNRTTRRVSPTEIGLAYYDRARRVLTDAGEADALVSAMQSEPSGLLRVSVATDFGIAHLSPIVGEFLARHPGISLCMTYENRYAELISEGLDMAIRIGDMEESSLRARKLAETARRLVGAPAYLERCGLPARIGELKDHVLLHDTHTSAGGWWKLRAPSGEMRQIRASGRLTVNDGRALLDAARSGMGIANLPCYLHGPALRAGEVVEVLPQLPREVTGIHAVYPPGPHVAPKVRAFIDFLIEAFAAKGPGAW